VFVEVEVEGLSGSGSGFVVTVDGDTALVVTNHHVVEPKIIARAAIDSDVIPAARTRPTRRIPRPPMTTPHIRPPTTVPFSRRPIVRELPPEFTPRVIIRTLKNAVVTVAFDSGTKDERTAKGELLALDPEYDLAVMRVKDVKDLPEPIDFEKERELTETMSVYTFGFPFGKVLATSKGRPTITVSRSAVSSLRENDDGQLAVVQIDGGLNPGNSGGPIVNTQGELVGVAVATIRNSSGIGLAIPAGQLRNMFEGRIGAVHLAGKLKAENTAAVVEVGVIDPLNKINSVGLHYVGASRVKVNADKDIESLEALPECEKMELTLEKQLASGEIALARASSDKEFLVQAVYTTLGGETRKTRISRQSLQPVAVIVAKPDQNSAPRAEAGGNAGRGGVAGGEPRRGETFAGGETKILGGVADPVFKDQAPEKGLLVGLEVGLGPFLNLQVVNAIRPIYRTDKKVSRGKQYGTPLKKAITVKAKDGYAVGGITIRSGLLVNGLSVTFMRIRDGQLDPSNSYESDWIGDRTGGSETTLQGDGTSVIGIIGKANKKDCMGLGLLFDEK
jgi:hypothetical protein